jgi:hypothetical protein
VGRHEDQVPKTRAPLFRHFVVEETGGRTSGSESVDPTEVSLSIEEASSAQFITFGSNALNSSGQHLIDEHVHFAFVIEIDVVDSKALCDGHVSKVTATPILQEI